MDVRCKVKSLVPSGLCVMRGVSEATDDRSGLDFVGHVRREFAFLRDLGFEIIEAMPTVVRYRRGDREATIYHGRSSYELGFEISHAGERYSMSELIRASDARMADESRNFVATTADGVARGTRELAELVGRYAHFALGEDVAFIARLRRQRESWSENYALDVLARQLRPTAEEAFRAGRYEEAARLYEQIRDRLTPAEMKKLQLARRRS